MAQLSLSIVNKIEREIREADTFQYIASDVTDEIVESLRQISVRSGMAIYIWSSEQGLVNIKSRQMPLPATRSIIEALKYASKNHYFAVYVFPAVNNKDLLEIKSTLPSATDFLKVNENTRYLFLINKKANFNFMSANANEIALHNQNTKKYKLRDSQWVLSNG